MATRTHDFPGDSAGKAIPYGVYDMKANAGWVNVGTDHDTAAFAVESIRRWWDAAGSSEYPRARRLLITADASQRARPGPRQSAEAEPGWPAASRSPGRSERASSPS